MSPILSTIIQALIEHIHNLAECRMIIRKLCEVAHLGTGGSPWIIACRSSDFHLYGRISFDEVFPAVNVIRDDRIP